MLKRLCIYCHYDANEIVSEADRFLLNELGTISSEIIVVVNGNLKCEDLSYIYGITKRVVIRPNEGMDAKAYEEVVLSYLNEDELQEYDELVLCNNTFFGPFIHFWRIFQYMENKKADFWGIDYNDEGIYRFLCSYFLVFRKNIIMHKEIEKFFSWLQGYSITDINTDVELFEVGISAYLQSQGYIFSSFCWSHGRIATRESYYCMREYNLPLLRKRGCRPEPQFNYQNVRQSINYIDTKYEYPIDWIIDYVQKSFGRGLEELENDEYRVSRYSKKILRISKEQLLEFMASSDPVYIYGAGHIGGKLWSMYRFDMNTFGGFIISDDQRLPLEGRKYGYPVLPLSDIDIEASIIVAATTEIADAMEQNLIDRDCSRYIRVW